MFCRKCGKEINNTSRFCPFCGTPVVMPAAPVPVTDPEPAASASATVEAPAAAEAAAPVMEAPAAEAAPAVETPAEAEADGYIADGDYDAAVSFLEDAYYDTGYNELYDKMDQVKADMKDALLEKAIENAKAEVAAGNYTEARSIINNAKEDYGYDSRFDDILAGIPVDTSLVGKWKLEYDMNDIIAETVGEDMDNFDSEFYVTFIFEFTEDGICRLSLDEDSFVKSFDSWKDDLLDYLIDMALEEYISDGSMTKKEFEKAFKSTYGMTLKEYFSEMLDEELDVSELLDETETEMKYYVEGDRLYLIDDTDTEDYYENFYIEGDTLVLGGDGSLSEAEILPGLSYPLQLIKVVD